MVFGLNIILHAGPGDHTKTQGAEQRCYEPDNQGLQRPLNLALFSNQITSIDSSAYVKHSGYYHRTEDLQDATMNIGNVASLKSDACF